jgi:hypothetical protein
VCEQLERRALMTASANLVAFRPVNEYIDYAQHPVAEATEADATRGPGIRINGDDDNRNGRPDFNDTTTAAGGDDDLVRVNVSGVGTRLTVGWTVPLAVWTSNTKTARIDNGASVSSGQSLWVEYVSSTHSTAGMMLTAVETPTSTTATDTLTFHSFRSVVIAIGGRGADPNNFGDPNLGAYNIAAQLYDQGYDVHLYAHSNVESNGRGAAYDEVVSAVLNRNADNVAIIGYSWGGGATYELAGGLQSNSAIAAAGYRLQYSAYIDAVQHRGLFSETRKPAGTSYHDNFYQRRDLFFKGNSVSGANNVNVTNTSWGRRLAHIGIDDDPTVQATIIANLTSRVVA